MLFCKTYPRDDKRCSSPPLRPLLCNNWHDCRCKTPSFCLFMPSPNSLRPRNWPRVTSSAHSATKSTSYGPLSKLISAKKLSYSCPPKNRYAKIHKRKHNTQIQIHNTQNTNTTHKYKYTTHRHNTQNTNTQNTKHKHTTHNTLHMFSSESNCSCYWLVLVILFCFVNAVSLFLRGLSAIEARCAVNAHTR